MSQLTSINPTCPFIAPLSSDPSIIQLGDQVQQLWNTQNKITQNLNQLVIQNNTNTPSGTVVSLVADVDTVPTGPRVQYRDVTVLAAASAGAFLKLGKLTFPVRVTQTGGSAGSSTAQCSFTYDVFEQDNITRVKTTRTGSTNAVSRTLVGHERPIIGKMTSGTYGLAYYDTSDALILLWVNEQNDGPVVLLSEHSTFNTVLGTTSTSLSASLVVPATGTYLIEGEILLIAGWKFTDARNITFSGEVYDINATGNTFSFNFVSYAYLSKSFVGGDTFSNATINQSTGFNSIGTMRRSAILSLTAGHTLVLRSYYSIPGAFSAGEGLFAYATGGMLQLTLLGR